MPKDGQIITFYSYKGGTGRTMSVANTACLLARRPTSGEALQDAPRVLAIDWDFEAPGLHRYFIPYFPEEVRKGLNGILGCIDLLREVRDHRKEFENDSFRNREIAKSLLSTLDFKAS